MYLNEVIHARTRNSEAAATVVITHNISFSVHQNCAKALSLYDGECDDSCVLTGAAGQPVKGLERQLP